MSALFNLFYIYDPWFFHVLRMAFVVGLLALAILGLKYLKKDLPQGLNIPLDSLGAILGLIGFSFIPLLINGSQDFSVVIQYSKILILFTFGLGIYQLFYCHPAGQLQVIRDLKIGIGLQALIGFLALMGLPFMVDMLLGTNAMMPRFFGSEQEYRLYNITSSAFFQLSLFYLVLLHFLLAYNAKHNSISSLFLFLMLCIGLISGRTFLMLSVISILLYFKWRYLPALIAFGLLIIGLALYMPEHRYVEHALEPLINIIKMIKIRFFGFPVETITLSASADNLVQNHLYLPEPKQLLMGDGYYYTSEGKYYGATDSGFIRQVLYGGVPYLLACAAFTFYFVYRLAQNWFNGSWKFILSLMFILSICHIKADTYAFPGLMLVLIMFLSLFGPAGKQMILFKRG
ncbi:hypothetical protein A4G20_04580 [Pasteurellaceae bacterium RH1A]|nr:hypothetical protein A4G20_04580 [Pasteurellaceae bacterium RH1A]